MPNAATEQVRRARVWISVVFAVHGCVTGSFSTRIPWLQDRLDLSPGQLGLALTFPAIGASLAMPLAGRMVHRFGNKAATRALIVLWGSSLALPDLCPNLLLLCPALFVYGASAGVADVAMNGQGVEVERRLGRSIMSGLHGMWSVGALVGSGVGALATHAGIDARPHLAATAAVLAILGFFACHGLLDMRSREHDPAPPRFALPPRSALAIGAIGVCAILGEGTSMDWCGVYLKNTTHASATVAAASYTAFACTMAVARLTGDLAVRRFGPVRTVRASGLTATLGGLLVVLAHSPAVAIAGFALLGVGIAVVIPLAFAAAGRSGESQEPGRPGNSSQAIAGVATITYATGLLAPAVFGAIADASSLTVSFALVTGACSLLMFGAQVLRPAAGALRVAGAETAAGQGEDLPGTTGGTEAAPSDQHG